MAETPASKRSHLLLAVAGIVFFIVGYAVISNLSPSARLHDNRGVEVSTDYSTDTKLLYYYLLYTDGILSNDIPLAKEGLQGLIKTDPSEQLFTEAILFLFSQREFEVAVSVAEQAIKLHPNNKNMLVFLAEGYSQIGEQEKAISLLEKSRKRGIESDFITEELIGLYLQTGQTDKANALLAAIPESKTTPATLFFKSKLYIQQGQFSKARQLLRLFTERYPDVVDAWIELGAVEEKMGNITASIEAYKRACQLNPENEEIWLHLAELQLSVQNVAAAFNTLQQHPNLAEYGFNGAILLSNNGYQSEAMILVNDSIQKGADPNEGAILLSTIVMRSGENYDEALHLLDSVKTDSRYYDLALERKAQILAHLDRCDEARQLVGKLHAKNVSTIELWGIEAYCHVREENFEKALQTLYKALQEFPDDPDLLFSQGSIYDSSGEKDKAFEIMEKLLAITPEDPKVLNYVGYTLAEQGQDLDRALALVQAAHEADPKAEYILDSLAWVHYKLGNMDLAWKYINQCLALAEEDPIIWEHYGDIAYARNDITNAAKGYRNALEKDPENRQDIEKKLDSITQHHKKIF